MVGHVKGLGLTHKFKKDPGQIWRGAPLFGADNEDLLREMGYTDEQIAGLLQEGRSGAHGSRTRYIERYRLRQVIPHMRDEAPAEEKK